MNDAIRDRMRFQYRIAGWTVDPATRRLSRNGYEVMLSPKAMDVFVYLADRAGEAVAYEELLETFWRGDITPANAVHKCIAEIRAALRNHGNAGDQPADGEEHGADQFIDTISRRGYRLNVPVEQVQVSGTPQTIEIPGSDDATHPSVNAALGQETGRSDESAVSPLQSWSRTRAATAFLVLAIIVASALLFVRNGETTSVVTAGTAAEPNGPLNAADDKPKVKRIRLVQFVVGEGSEGLSWLGRDLADDVGRYLTTNPEFEMFRSETGVADAENGDAESIGYVLSGTVDKVDGRLRVDVELTGLSDEGIVYAQTFDEPLDQLSVVRETIASEVHDALVVILDPERREDMLQQGTKNPRAYLAYLEALQLMRRGDRESLQKAADGFRNVLVMDPSFDATYTCLAATLRSLTLFQSAVYVEKIEKELVALAEAAEENAATPGVRYNVQLWRAMIASDLEEQERMLRVLIESGDSSIREFVPLEERYGYLLERAGLFEDAKQYRWYDVRRRLPDENPDHQWILEEWNTSVWLRGAEEPLHRITQLAEQALVRGQKPSIDNLSPLVTLNAMLGRFDESKRWLSILKSEDRLGLYFAHADLMYRSFAGEFTRDSADYQRLFQVAGSSISAAQVAFVLGDVDTGVKFMRQMNRYELGIFQFSRWSIESHFPKVVRNDPRYRAMLEDIGLGETFRKTMQAGVGELTPYTGIYLAEDAPDKAVLGNWRYQL